MIHPLSSDAECQSPCRYAQIEEVPLFCERSKTNWPNRDNQRPPRPRTSARREESERDRSGLLCPHQQYFVTSNVLSSCFSLLLPCMCCASFSLSLQLSVTRLQYIDKEKALDEKSRDALCLGLGHPLFFQKEETSLAFQSAGYYKSKRHSLLPSVH